MSERLLGRCLCGGVEFSVQDEFEFFHLCHCKQCQQITGSAFAANLFTTPDNIEWLTGDALLVRYEVPDRDFTKVFCSVCGSGLPFLTQNGRHLIVPAGCLDEQPTLKPQDNIFWSEHIPWLESGLTARRFDSFSR